MEAKRASGDSGLVRIADGVVLEKEGADWAVGSTEASRVREV